MADNIKNAEIVIRDVATAALEGNPLASDSESQAVAFADKLGDILSSNSDALGVLVKIRKDTRAIHSHLLKLPGKPAKAILKTPMKPPIGSPPPHTRRIAERPKNPTHSREVSEKEKSHELVRTTASKTKESKVAQTQPTKKPIKPEFDRKPKAPTKKPVLAGTDRGKTSSKESLEIHRNEKERIKDRKSILGGVKDAITNVGTLGISAATDAVQNQGVTDIVGTAIGGPLWEVVKEVKEVADNTDFSKVKNAKEALTGKKKTESALPPGVKKDSTGRLRDGRGKYLKTSGKVAGRSEAKSKLIELKNSKNIEDQKRISGKLSELGIQTVDALHDTEREEETRHKDLIKAVEEIGTGGTIGNIRHGRDMLRDARGRRKSKKAKKAKLRDGGRPRGMVERKRRPDAMGRIKTPTTTPSRRPRRHGRGGKFGKIAGLVGGLLGGGGLLSGIFGGDDETPIADMAVDEAMSFVEKKAGTAATKVAPKVGMKGAAKVGMRGAEKLGTKGVAKLGMKGAAKFGLRALGPLAAVGMAGYDAFQGWNDRDMQAKAFDLKDGQEATTGQKASSSLANVLDMGGIGTGLLSMFGMDADTSDIAKGIHGAGSWIGGALGMTDQKDGEKDIIQKTISAPIATVTEGVKSIWGWITGGKDKDAQIKTAETVSPSTPIGAATSPQQASPVSRIEHPKPLPKIEKINASASQNATTGTPKATSANVDNNSVMNRLIRALEKNVKSPLPFQQPNQQPQAPKSNIKADFEDSMLTLMAYDRI